MIITWGQNPVGGSAGGRQVIEVRNKVDAVVCISPYFAEIYVKLNAIDRQSKGLAHPLPVYYLTVRMRLAREELIPITGFSPLNIFTVAQTKGNTLLTPLLGNACTCPRCGATPTGAAP